MNFAMLLLCQLPVRVSLLELRRLFGGVDQESLDGRDVDILRRREGEGWVSLCKVVSRVPVFTLIRHTVGPLPFRGPGPTAEVTEVARVIEHVGSHGRRHAADACGRRGVGGHGWRPHVHSWLTGSQRERKAKNGGDRNGTNTKYKIQVTMKSNVKVRAENKHLKLKLKLQHCTYDVE